MSLPNPSATNPAQFRLGQAASTLGYEIVDIEGFLKLVEQYAIAQSSGLEVLESRAEALASANVEVLEAVTTMAERTSKSVEDVKSSTDRVRRSSDNTHGVATWVQEVFSKTASVSETISAVKNNNLQIASIATQVNTLAINAKIEAARAGDAGRGFAVVADAINELSRKTRDAAVEISGNIEALTSWISTLSEEAQAVAEQASSVLSESGGTNDALGRVEQSILETDAQAERIKSQAQSVETVLREFKPALAKISDAIAATSSGIEKTSGRIQKLVDTSETIVQATAQFAEGTEDAKFISIIGELAASTSAKMEEAIASGRITLSRLFDRNYRPIPNSNPEQFLTESTTFLDEVMPSIQEPALDLSPKVVFCAAVDMNGYLPTHNRKFSQPLTDDPVWNAANCRNRRIFDDRVGLKAGRNTDPFLLQVYRRDMGGGEFKMMKDLSAPIFVQGRHWGGLRFAYTF